MSYEQTINTRVTGTEQVASAITATDKLAGSTNNLSSAIDKQQERTQRIAAAVQSYIESNAKLSEKQAKLALDEVKLEQLREKHRMTLERLAAAAKKHAETEEEANKRIASSLKDFVQNPLGAAGDAAEKFALTYGKVGIAAVGVGAAIAVVGGLLVRNAADVAQYAQEVSNLASRTGLTTTETQLFGRASEVAGVNAGTLTTAMRTLSRGMSENSEEGKKQKAVLNELGIGAEAALQPMGQLLPEIFKKLSDVGDVMDRDRMTIALFGRSGLEMEPLFAHFKELEDRVKATGVIMDEQAIAKARAYKEELVLLGFQWDALKQKMAVPIIGTILRVFGDHDAQQARTDQAKATYDSAMGRDKVMSPANLELFQQWQAAKQISDASVAKGSDVLGTKGPGLRSNLTPQERRDYNAGSRMNPFATDELSADKLMAPSRANVAATGLSTAALEAQQQQQIQRIKANQAAIESALKSKEGDNGLGEAKAQLATAQATLRAADPKRDVSKEIHAVNVAKQRVAAIEAETKETAERAKQREAAERALESLRKKDVGTSPTAELVSQIMALPADKRGAHAAEFQGMIQRKAQEEFQKTLQAGPTSPNGEQGPLGNPAERFGRKLTLSGVDPGDLDPEAVSRMKQAVSTWNSAELGRANTDIRTVRDTASRQSRLQAAAAGPGDELGTIRQQLELQKQAAEQEFKIKEAHSDIFDIEKARLDKAREIGDLELDYETKILELKKQQKEETVSMAVGLVMAAQHGQVTSYLKSQAEGLEGKVLTNAARMAIDSPAGKSITDKLHAGAGTTMGKLLEGTPFGPDPMKSALDRNTEATIANTATMAGGGAGAAGGGAAGAVAAATGGSPISKLLRTVGISGGSTVTAATNWGAGGYDGTGMSKSEWNKAMSSLNAGEAGPDATGGTSTNYSSPASSGMSTGTKVGIAAAAIGGGIAAYKDFKRGGASGALAGTGALLGAAASIPGPQQPFLAAASILTSITASIIGDSHEKRQADISHTLATSQYMAPVAINASMTTAGTYSDFDRFGGVRGSNLSPYPSVEQGFFDYRRGVTVPGRTDSYFGGAQGTAVTPQQIQVNVQTLDSRSFNDNSHLIAEGLNHALMNNKATGLQETLRSM